MIRRVVRRGVNREAARRTCSKPWSPAGSRISSARKPPVIEKAGQIGAYPGVFRIVIAKNFPNPLGHIPLSPVGSVVAVCTPISQHRGRIMGCAEQAGAWIQRHPDLDSLQNFVSRPLGQKSFDERTTRQHRQDFRRDASAEKNSTERKDFERQVGGLLIRKYRKTWSTRERIRGRVQPAPPR